MANNYVDNADLLNEIVEYRERYFKAIEEGRDPPRANDKIGKAIMDIAHGFASNRNFAGYSYRAEMEEDGVMACVKAIHKFDPERSKNPFAYFTQICYYAFLQRIGSEKKQAYIKYKALENAVIMNSVASISQEDETQFQAFLDHIDYDKISPLIEKFEAKAEKKKQPKKGVEVFFDDEESEING